MNLAPDQSLSMVATWFNIATNHRADKNCAQRSELMELNNTMKNSGRYILALACWVMAAYPAGAAAASNLHSPWDTTQSKTESSSYPCSDPVVMSKSIDASSFYSDSKKSIIDPEKYAAYQTSRDQYQNVMREAEKAADKFQATGNIEAANCVLNVLSAQAAAHAMTGVMSSNQAFYVQNWTLGALAVSWLKVRSANPGTDAQRTAVLGWMKSVAMQTRAYFTERHMKNTKDGTNNHYYWAGFAVMATGIGTNDRSLYDWGKGTFEYAASSVQADGTLPLEMDRGQRALHYHLFALAPIIMMAEFGEANGQDMYASHDRAVQHLVTRSTDGLLNNQYFAEKAGVPQDTPEKGGIKSNDIAVLAPYLKRFPDPKITILFDSVKLRPYSYLGGLPPR